MEKLIELLNEYKEKKNICNTDMDGQLEIGNYRYVNYPCAERLCSKKYGFIQWLVDNDKIDFESQAMQYAKEDLSKFLNERKDKNGMSDEYAMILMLLSIQDKPIEFLISILK